MALQGSSAPLQGGTGIKLPTYNPQPASTRVLQPASGGSVLGSGRIFLNSGNQTLASGNKSMDDSRALLDSINSLKSQIAGMNRVVIPPSIDYNSIYNKAKASAESAVNPLYIKQLHDFLAGQAAQKAQTEKQTQMNVQNLKDTLGNTLAGNEIAKTRAGEDAATNLDTINTQEDQFQTDSGQKFAADRIAGAEDLAKSGLTGGIGAQQTEAAQTARNTTEARQGATFQKARVAQELTKARTFEDLSRAGDLAKESETKGEAQQKFDLANFIENQGYQTTAKKAELEGNRLTSVLQEQARQAKLGFASWLSNISNPAQRSAAVSAYGGLF